MLNRRSIAPWRSVLLGLVSMVGVCCLMVRGAAGDYASTIQPIFDTYCGECHGETKQKAGLDLSTPEGVFRGSQDGPVLVPHEPEASLLLRLIREGKMPPEDSDRRLPPEKLAELERWIDEGAATPASTASEDPEIDQHDVLPILHLRCVSCHGRKKQEAGLDLRSVESILKGGDSGPVLVAGRPEESLMIQKIAADEMPPKRDLVKASVKPVREGELDILRRWIKMGLPIVAGEKKTPSRRLGTDDSNFWAFQSPRQVRVPEEGGDDGNRNPIDRFVLKKLREIGLEFAPEADRMTLIRRVSFDLRGLPPGRVEIESFLGDERGDAYERMIDRILASPAYGERWGRYWLDLAGYSESEGMQHADELRPAAFRYRDYVIQALNADKPYDRFVTEQLAGDELVRDREREVLDRESYDALVATGFLRMVPDGTNANITNFVPHRLDVIANEMQVLGSSIMGLTLHCARCHSHKFDPISIEDYYRFLAVFKGAFDEHDWLPPRERRLEQGLDEDISRWRQGERERQKEIEGVKNDSNLSEEQRDKAIKALEARRELKPFIRALWDRGEPTETYVLTRGDYLNASKPVNPGVPAWLAGDSALTGLDSNLATDGTTGRRLEFARWLTRADHPLTSRVIVNRVWKHHFGRGIVSSLDNFGRAGSLPSHPELLDWLATTFVEQGWRLKSLHRLMMTSRTYRQSSKVSDRMNQLDPTNRFWSRMPLRRLEGEILRDTMLWAAGRLLDKPFGPSDGVDVNKDGLVTAQSREGMWRRSVYVQQRRTQVPTLLQSFDLPTMSPNCVDRSESTVATQALHLKNNRLIHELSAAFAAEVMAEHPDNRRAQVQSAFVRALGRYPSDLELQSSIQELDALGGTELSGARVMQAFCHALYNAAAFLYVD